MPAIANVVSVPTPVILDCVAVIKLPVNVLADTLFAPLMFPPLPLVVKLPAVNVPVAFNVPAILTPVPVTTTILALPTALMFTLPLALGILTLLLPLLMPLVDIDSVTQLRLPLPSVCKYWPVDPPVTLILPTAPKLTLLAFMKFTVPLLVSPVSVPTLVIFGCAAVVNVPVK